jgi:hypothetical protein
MADVIDLTERRREREPGHRLVVSFEGRPDECTCADFVLGFEAGMLRARLSEKPATWGGTYHAKNLLMLQRIAEASGYGLVVTPAEDPTWIFVDFHPVGAS